MVAAPDTTSAKVGGAWIDADTPWESSSRSMLSARAANLLLEVGVWAGIVTEACAEAVHRSIALRG